MHELEVACLSCCFRLPDFAFSDLPSRLSLVFLPEQSTLWFPPAAERPETDLTRTCLGWMKPMVSGDLPQDLGSRIACIATPA